MNIKKIFAALCLSSTIFSTAFAAGADDELSIMAAEQRKETASDTETFENVEPEPVNRSSNKKPSNTQPTVNRPSNTQPQNTPQTVNRPSSSQSTVSQPNVGMPNPIKAYGSFEELTEELGYIPLYVPKSSGYALNYMSIIGGKVADLRYDRRWETDIKLIIRTYKRPNGEELKDISGVQGVKWRVDLSGGIPIYLARIDDNSNAAAWSVGQYTFAAMTDNLSFAAFRTLVFDELVDLSTHYHIEVD